MLESLENLVSFQLPFCHFTFLFCFQKQKGCWSERMKENRNSGSSISLFSRRITCWILEFKRIQFQKLMFLNLIIFFRRKVLEKHLSHGLDDMGNVKWSLVLCVFSVFLLVYFSLWKGVRSSGKVTFLNS